MAISNTQDYEDIQMLAKGEEIIAGDPIFATLAKDDQMRKYKEELVARLQNDSKSVMEDGVEFIVKPIPEIEKTSEWIQEC